MPYYVDVVETLNVGSDTYFQSESREPYAVVFEDDGETGYFYALDLERQDQPIVDALHVYNVENVVDRDKPAEVKLGWDESGSVAMLMINDYPHAVVDFARKRAVCRTGFPPADGTFTNSHDWDESLLDVFR